MTLAHQLTADSRARNRTLRAAGLVIAVGIGFAGAFGQNVAWADTTGGDSPGKSPNQQSTTTTTASVENDSVSSTGSTGIRPNPTPSISSSDGAQGKKNNVVAPPAGTDSTSATKPTVIATALPPMPPPDAFRKSRVAPERGSLTTTTRSPLQTTSPEPRTSLVQLDTRLLDSVSFPAQATPATNTLSPTGVTVTAATATPAAVSALAPTPAPVSPIAELIALPARIANAVLGLIGVTPAAGTTPPISPAPIVQLLWAAFREFENFFGLNAIPANQPVMIHQTFTGSLITRTPTVAQFLNAATTEYVLGGTPAGLVPLTVDGFPLTYTNDGSGAAAQVWVTPQQQIIIAYSGTTGGTNLLFNPLIAIAQAFADYQAGFTDTIPQAFIDSLAFARQVQTIAAAQGYAPDSVFVTGHSLGGWEAEYVSQNTGLAGIGFEAPGLTATVPGNGADSLFVNVETYGDVAAYISSDIPGLQPFTDPYVPGGGARPHYGSIVFLGDPSAQIPLINASALWGTSLFGDVIFAITAFGQFLQYHLPGVQAYSLDVDPDPVLLPGTGTYAGPIYTGFGDFTIPEFLAAASAAGILFKP